MVELRTLHVTDVHDDFEKYQVIAQYIVGKKGSDNAVDAVFITGDFIEGEPGAEGKTAHKIFSELKAFTENGPLKAEYEDLQNILKKYVKDGKIDLDDVDEAGKKKIQEFEAKSEAFSKETNSIVTKLFHEAYSKHVQALASIDVPILAILGNHDVNSGYEILKDKVTFVEKTNKATIPGKSGLEFIIKGDLNTWEFPAFYGQFSRTLAADHFIPYHSGYSLTELSKKVNELQKKVNEGEVEQLKEAQTLLEQIVETRKQVLAYNQSERQRLSDKNEADIYLTHKLPNCKKARPDIKGPLSDITLEYAANSNAVYGGHFHDGQIGYKTIENLLKQGSTETTIIDGVEVPVYYLDENEPWELNPGTSYFFVTEYDANKQIEQVVIHEFYYEEAA